MNLIKVIIVGCLVLGIGFFALEQNDKNQNSYAWDGGATGAAGNEYYRPPTVVITIKTTTTTSTTTSTTFPFNLPFGRGGPFKTSSGSEVRR